GTLRGGPTLARSLLDGGYRTLAATSVIHLDPGFGFGDGFARFAACEGGLRGWLRPARPFLLPKILLRTLGAGRPARPGRETLERARALWVEAEPDRPRFLWVHLFDPPRPYTPEGGPRTAPPRRAAPTPRGGPAEIARLRRLYDGEIRDVRALLAGFLAELRADSAARGRELVVALTSDHGEALGEHGASDHGDLPYDEGLRVPLWVAGPGIPPREVATPYSLTDVGPGLAAWLLGIDPWPTGPLTRRRRPGVARSGAESFAAALRGEAPAAPGEVLIQTDHGAFRNVAVVRGGWKVIGHELVTPETMERKPLPSAGVPAGMPWRGPFELYDLVADPRELDNLYPERLPRSGRFEQDPARQAFGDSLDEIRQRLRELDDWPYRRPEAGVAPEIQDALRELGYLGDD
ncbi:MAG: sulfatase-like hydrolase/transferase, partial [Planctomycetes bacterium]|nr:sulfatase-like hydrolase/transferase [Planctomycetota bacterium]